MTPADSVGTSRGRRAVPELMITLGVLALTLAALLSTGRRAVLFPDNFADHVAASLKDPRVAAFVADRVTDAVLKEEPDLTAFRPLILATTKDAVSSSAFQALARGAARSAHASLFSEGGRTVIVSIPDVGVLMRSALLKANPALAAKIPDRARGVLTSIGERRTDQFIMRVWQIASRSLWLTGALLLAAVFLIVGGVVFLPDRRVALVRLGSDLVVAGVVFMLLTPAGRAVAGLIPQSLWRARPPRVCGTRSRDRFASGPSCSAGAAWSWPRRGARSSPGSILSRPCGDSPTCG